jgi:uncharacterized protein (DUF1778 family)
MARNPDISLRMALLVRTMCIQEGKIEMKTTTTIASADDRREGAGAKDARLNLRVSARQDQLIRRAAAAVDKSVTEFVLDTISVQAERVLAEQRWFMLSETDWARFHELLDTPIAADTRLAALLTERTTVDLSDL